MVSYAHKNNTDNTRGVRFAQYKEDPLPQWAVDVLDYFEDELEATHRDTIEEAFEAGVESTKENTND
jgi:aspartyl/asparaginyl beta-hydroxylase (cupin superfamily)|tara:strand:- start:36 stop:236 length:201 start_codon:yes stop_codon:yes gene_type:complete